MPDIVNKIVDEEQMLLVLVADDSVMQLKTDTIGVFFEEKTSCELS